MMHFDRNMGPLSKLLALRGADAASAPEVQQPFTPDISFLQRALLASGHYKAAITAKLDQQTIDAIKEYQKDTGLPVTGAVTPLLLKTLGAQAPSVPTPKKPATPLSTIFKLSLAAAGVTALVYALDRKREAAAVAEDYSDVVDPDDLEDEDDEDDEPGEEDEEED